jgi:hypothetical protein
MLNFKSSGAKMKMFISAETAPLLGGTVMLVFLVPIQHVS